MKWGELQSVIQLAVAVNTIYLSLKDIRTPSERREQDAIERIRARINEMTIPHNSAPAYQGYLDLKVSFSDLIVSLQEEIAKLERVDEYVRIFCLITIFTFTVVLIYSSYQYNFDVPPGAIFALSTVGFLPICVGLVINIGFLRGIKARTIKKRRYVERQLTKFS